MKSHILTLIFSLVSVSASASISLSSDSATINSKAYSIETEYVQNMQWEREGYSNNLKLREQRKVGAGVAVGGQLGMASVNIEFNIEDADGVVTGFGTGPGYNSFQLSWKHNFSGDYLSPYTTVGYSRWYNSAGGKSDYSDSPVLDRVLTDAEKREGRFGTDFLFGSIGLQYNQLSGPLAGFSVYGEIVMMAEAKRSLLVPTGAVGTTYFF